MGACCGAGLAGAAITIARLYAGQRQASMLIITDSCFSIAGIITSWAGGKVTGLQCGVVRGLFVCGCFITCALITLVAVSTFPETRSGEAQDGVDSREVWPVGAWLSILALLIYTLSQSAFLLWLPNYAEVTLGAPRHQAGLMISHFWTGMLITQLFASWWVLRIGVRRTVLVGASAQRIGNSALLERDPNRQPDDFCLRGGHC